jgi:hypothetical protein
MPGLNTYYDQLGVGNSEVHDDPSLWNLARYTEKGLTIIKASSNPMFLTRNICCLNLHTHRG